jgi:hypothetical protein
MTDHPTHEGTVDVYPVGALDDLIHLRGILRRYGWRAARSRVRFILTTLTRRVRRRQWRAVKNYFNGYLAEPAPFPDGMRRCGSGWTHRRALRSLRRHGYTGPLDGMT